MTLQTDLPACWCPLLYMDPTKWKQTCSTSTEFYIWISTKYLLNIIWEPANDTWLSCFVLRSCTAWTACKPDFGLLKNRLSGMFSVVCRAASYVTWSQPEWHIASCFNSLIKRNNKSFFSSQLQTVTVSEELGKHDRVFTHCDFGFKAFLTEFHSIKIYI